VGRAATLCLSKQHRTYWWPRRKWRDTTETGARSFINQRFLERQYNTQTTELGSSQDSPFAEILLPIPEKQKVVGSNVPVTGVSKTEKNEVGEIGGDTIWPNSLEEPGDNSAGNTNASTPSTPALQNDTEQEAYNPPGQINGLGDHPTEYGVVNEAPEATAGGESKNLGPLLAPCNGEPSSEHLIGTKQQDSHLPEPGQFEDDISLSDQMEIDDQTSIQFPAIEINQDPEPEREIHILGSGAVGKFIAHSLAGAPDAPPVTLLIHRPWIIKQWHDRGGEIRLLRGDQVDVKSGFKAELSEHFYAEAPRGNFGRPGKDLLQPDTIIDNLVVTTQGQTTVSALAAIRHRFQSSSTICFIQDSLGITDYVNGSVFPDPVTRPNYILGSITHNVQSTEDKFSIVEARSGTMALTMIPREVQVPRIKKEGFLVRRMDLDWPASSKYLMRTLSRVPELCARGLKPETFYKAELEQLAISSVVGPVSVVYECFSDQILGNQQACKTMKLLLKEISLILRSLPEVSHITSIDEFFGARRLNRLIMSVLEKAGRNRTAMLQAVMDGKETGIDFYNGYLMRRAKELGIDCPRLELIISMVKGKQSMRRREKNSYIPFRYEV
jgi:2-dehydropantoate 2-reductase